MIEHARLRRPENHGHRGHAERLQGAVRNGELAGRLVDLLDRALGQFGLGLGRRARTIVMCRVVGLRKGHRRSTAEHGQECGGNKGLLHDAILQCFGL
ncbi:hypothetical protein SDC9_198924 [bioreactor metagenome]|uniref:Uncharacterized protein n=1 Tax=bioreactor metagenome TaxID=1076179 RepID=A0A645IJ21_9ZZZZ